MENDNVKFKVISILILLIFNFAFVINLVSAGHPDEFISYASNKIYKDCVSKDLEINYIIPDPGSTEDLGRPHTIKSWPYALDYLLSLLSGFNSNTWKNIDGDFFKKKYAVFRGGGYIGVQILECGSHWLDISGNDWYWDGSLIENPKLALSDIKTYGDHNNVIVGNNNKIETNTNNNEINQVNIYDDKYDKMYSLIIIGFVVVIVVVLSIYFYLPIYRKNKYWKNKFNRKEVKNSKNMYIAKYKENSRKVCIIENKEDKKICHDIKNQYTRDKLGFSQDDESRIFSGDENTSYDEVIEIVDLRKKIMNDLKNIIHLIPVPWKR